MRLFKNNSPILLALFLAFMANAISAKSLLPTDELVVFFRPVSDNSKAVVYIPNFQGESAKLEIMDADGNMLFSKTINSEDVYAEVFNFKNLESGNYVMKATAQNMESRQAFSLDKEGNLVAISKTISVFSPLVKVTEAQVDIKMNNPFSEAVTVKIFNFKGESVYEKVEFKDFSNRLNLQNLPKGLYTLEITSGSKSFSKSLEL